MTAIGKRTTATLATRPAVNGQQRRWWVLRVLIALFVGVNFLALTIQTSSPRHVLLFAGWVLAMFAGEALLDRWLPSRDRLIFPLVMFLSGWGLVLIDRLQPFFALRQGVWLLVAVGVMLLVARSGRILQWVRQYRYLILLAGLGLLVTTIFLGQNPSGIVGAPQLWLGLGNLFFQPSELLKVLLIAFWASYFGEQIPVLRSEQRLRQVDQASPWLSPRILGPTVLMWSLAMALVVWQRDLGTAAIFFAVFLVMFYAASGERWILIGGVALLAIAGLVAYQLFSVVELRVDIWLNPWPEANGRAYQIVQSLMAFASGSVFGQGIGQGSPTYIPVVHSDFVFAAMAEEYGLLGVIAMVSALAVFIARGLRLAMQQQARPFYGLLAVGLAMQIAIQSGLIMAGVLKLLPLTGVTLPFVSYGGSSLVMSFISVGLLLRISAEVS